MTRITDLLAAGPHARRSSSSRPRPTRRRGRSRRPSASWRRCEPSFVSVTYGARRLHPRAHPRHRHPHPAATPASRRWPTSPASPTAATELHVAARRVPRRRHREHPRPGRRPAGRRLDRRPATSRTPPSSIELVREVGDFSVGVAAHPELHPRSHATAPPTGGHLAAKLALADFGITQFFFEVEPYLPHGRRAGRARLHQAGARRRHAVRSTSPASGAWPP